MVTLRSLTAAESNFELEAAIIEHVLDPGVEGDLVEDRDSLVLRNSGATIAYEAQITAGVPCEFESLDPSIATVNDEGYVTRVSDGRARILAKSSRGMKRVLVNVSQSEGVPVDVWQSYLPGTLGAHLFSQINAKIDGKNPATDREMYVANTLEAGRNPNFWLAGVAGLEAIGFGVTPDYWGGAAITPNHAVYADHYRPGSDKNVNWKTAAGALIQRDKPSWQQVGATDILVARIDGPLPESIPPIKIAPADLWDYLPRLKWGGAVSQTPQPGPEVRVPVVYSCQHKRLSIGYLEYLSTLPTAYHAVIPNEAMPSYSSWHETRIGGDSGGPVCLLIEGELVLLTTWHGHYFGPRHGAYLGGINSAITSLGGGGEIQLADLSGFPSYPE